MENQVRYWREKRGLSRRELASKISTGESQIVKLERGERKLTVDWLKRLAKGLNVTEAQLLEEEHVGNTPEVPEEIADRATVDIPEYDVRASMGDGFIVDSETVKDLWTFSRRYLVEELRLGTRDLVVIELVGDSMAPTLLSGDRALVDMTDKRVGTPGIFALWDGDGTVAKRIERVPNTSPQKIRLISDNSLHGSYEVLAEQTNIIGRIVWYARRM